MHVNSTLINTSIALVANDVTATQATQGAVLSGDAMMLCPLESCNLSFKAKSLNSH
jgi:hypothetical protein